MEHSIMDAPDSAQTGLAVARELDVVLQMWNDANSIHLKLGYYQARASLQRGTFVVLDKQPRHDTVLSDELLSTLTNTFSSRSAIYNIGKRLKKALYQIEEALKDDGNALKGRYRHKYKDRLVRHRDETVELLSLFQSQEARISQPFAIRQDICSVMHSELSEVLDEFAALRRDYKGKWLPGGIYAELLDIEAELLRLRAQLGRWRDNPSQKLASSFEKWHARLHAAGVRQYKVVRRLVVECTKRGYESGLVRDDL